MKALRHSGPERPLPPAARQFPCPAQRTRARVAPAAKVVGTTRLASVSSPRGAGTLACAAGLVNRSDAARGDHNSKRTTVVSLAAHAAGLRGNAATDVPAGDPGLVLDPADADLSRSAQASLRHPGHARAASAARSMACGVRPSRIARSFASCEAKVCARAAAYRIAQHGTGPARRKSPWTSRSGPRRAVHVATFSARRARASRAVPDDPPGRPAERNVYSDSIASNRKRIPVRRFVRRRGEASLGTSWARARLQWARAIWTVPRVGGDGKQEFGPARTVGLT